MRIYANEDRQPPLLRGDPESRRSQNPKIAVERVIMQTVLGLYS